MRCLKTENNQHFEIEVYILKSGIVLGEQETPAQQQENRKLSCKIWSQSIGVKVMDLLQNHWHDLWPMRDARANIGNTAMPETNFMHTNGECVVSDLCACCIGLQFSFCLFLLRRIDAT